MKRYSPAFSLQDDPFLKKRRLRRMALLALIAAAMLVAAVLVPRVLSSYEAMSGKRTHALSLVEVAALWENRDIQAVKAACDNALSINPSDGGYLAFKGLSLFYLSLAESEVENRSVLLEDTVFTLRKALLSCPVPLEKAALYTLGKAYFHKGFDFYPEAIEYLTRSMHDGTPPLADAWEYMALASQRLGLQSDSVSFFRQAMELKPSSAELKAAAAKAYLELGDLVEAESLASTARVATVDDYVRERCSFILADIYRLQGRHDEALDLYGQIKESNPESADAWFYEGLVYEETGDPIKARASWRKAVSIDPMHTGARQKLAERT